jgi:hypothetical protein
MPATVLKKCKRKNSPQGKLKGKPSDLQSFRIVSSLTLQFLVGVYIILSGLCANALPGSLNAQDTIRQKSKKAGTLAFASFQGSRNIRVLCWKIILFDESLSRTTRPPSLSLSTLSWY